MEMQNIVRLANKFLVEQRITKLPIDIDDFKRIYQDNKIDLFSYSQSKHIIKAADAEEYMDRPSFAIIREHNPVVFYEDTLSYADKLFCFAHELGHIWLKHTYYGILGKALDDETTDIQEREANAFACSILAPLSVLRKVNVKSVQEIQRLTLLDPRRSEHVLGLLMENFYEDHSDKKVLTVFFPGQYKKKDIISRLFPYVMILCILGIIGTLCYSRSANLPSRSPSTLAEAEKGVNAAIHDVFISKEGDKYHTADCQYRNANMLEVSIEEAENWVTNRVRFADLMKHKRFIRLSYYVKTFGERIIT